MPTEMTMEPGAMREVIEEGIARCELAASLYAKRGCVAGHEDVCPGCEAEGEWMDWRDENVDAALLRYALRGVEAEEREAKPYGDACPCCRQLMGCYCHEYPHRNPACPGLDAPEPQNCTRAKGHDGPCNGWPCSERRRK